MGGRVLVVSLGLALVSGVAFAFEEFPAPVPVVTSCPDGQRLVAATHAKALVVVDHGQSKIDIRQDTDLLGPSGCEFTVTKPGIYKDRERVPVEEKAGQVRDDADRCNRIKRGQVFRWINTPAFANEIAVVAEFTKGVPAHCVRDTALQAPDAGGSK